MSDPLDDTVPLEPSGLEPMTPATSPRDDDETTLVIQPIGIRVQFQVNNDGIGVLKISMFTGQEDPPVVSAILRDDLAMATARLLGECASKVALQAAEYRRRNARKLGNKPAQSTGIILPPHMDLN